MTAFTIKIEQTYSIYFQRIRVCCREEMDSQFNFYLIKVTYKQLVRSTLSIAKQVDLIFVIVERNPVALKLAIFWTSL
jgi:hypothetical protein